MLSLRSHRHLKTVAPPAPFWVWFALSALALGALDGTRVFAASPVLNSITPRGIQRGAESELFFNGGRLTDAQEIFFYSPGFQVLELKALSDGQVKVKIKVAPECALGEHAARVRAASGISELRTFFVSPFPNVLETEPNGDFAKPQKVPFGSTINGVADNEDIDYYLIEAKKGQRIAVEVEGMRLGTTIFDPYVAILDMGRFVLASSDDSPLLYQDCACAVVAPQDGTYVIEVRETSYAGNGACQYRLHVGGFPRPLVVYPAGGKVGEELTVRYLGDPMGEISEKVKLPPTPTDRFPLFAKQGNDASPSPNFIRVSAFDNIMEVEPNNDFAQATKTDLVVPLAFNGIISQPGDVDCFRFKAKAGQQFDVHVYARRLRSPLDPVLNIYNGAGGGIAGSDDSGGPDSYVRVGIPADGEYIVRINDHLNKGGPDYIFRVEFLPVVPTLSVNIPKVANYSQERQTISVPKGNRYATLVAVGRGNFGGPLNITPENFPKGITAVTDVMPDFLTVMPMVFEAAPDAPIAGNLANLIGRHADPKQNIAGGFTQYTELIVGNPGQSTYWSYTSDKVAVAVTEEIPFKISIVEPKVPLVHNGSMNLKIVAERKPGFTAPINVYMLGYMPGFGFSPGVTIPEKQNEVLYPLNANTGAPVRPWKIAVVAQSDAGKGPIWASSQLANLNIAAPFVNTTIDMAATEQGQATEVVCKLTHATPFEGKARMELVGLPAQVTTAPIEVTKADKEAVFKVTTAKTSPPGQHRTLFCQLVITQNNEPIVHNIGHGGVLRIDPPPPPKKNEPPKPVVAAAPMPMPQQPMPPAKPPERRLTRLEKLRLEQAERAKAGGK